MVKAVEDEVALKSLLDKATTIVIGPGLGQSEWSVNCAKAAFENISEKTTSLVIDADALNLLSQNKNCYPRL